MWECFLRTFTPQEQATAILKEIPLVRHFLVLKKEDAMEISSIPKAFSREMEMLHGWYWRLIECYDTIPLEDFEEYCNEDMLVGYASEWMNKKLGSSSSGV